MKKISEITTPDPFEAKVDAEQDSFIAELEAEFLTDDVLEQAKQQIAHKEYKVDGTPMAITNIYFLLKMSDKYADLMRKVYPYKTFKSSITGEDIPGRPANPKIMPITAKILAHEGIKFTQAYLTEQLTTLNRSYGF